jgi:hypothetical protein
MNPRALALALAAVSLGACRIDNMTSLQVAAICLPPDDATTCTFEAECGNTEWIGVTTMDAVATDVLHLVVQVNNQLDDNEDRGTGRANGHDAYVTEMDVEYSSPVAIPRWRQAIGPYLVPADGAGSLSIFPIDVATPGSRAAQAAIEAAVPVGGSYRLVANVRLLGKYQDERDFETAVFPVAIDVCDGCLFGGLDPAQIAAFDCDAVATGAQHYVACPNIGQAPAQVDCVE